MLTSFCNIPTATVIYTLSLHDALPIWLLDDKTIDCIVAAVPDHWHRRMVVEAVSAGKDIYIATPSAAVCRSEEHTSELQSHSDLVCRLLREKNNQQSPCASHAQRCHAR